MYPSNEITSTDPACDQSGMMFKTPLPTRGRCQSFRLLGPNAKRKLKESPGSLPGLSSKREAQTQSEPQSLETEHLVRSLFNRCRNKPKYAK